LIYLIASNVFASFNLNSKVNCRTEKRLKIVKKMNSDFGLPFEVESRDTPGPADRQEEQPGGGFTDGVDVQLPALGLVSRPGVVVVEASRRLEPEAESCGSEERGKVLRPAEVVRNEGEHRLVVF
jgi:hypothetical protein